MQDLNDVRTMLGLSHVDNENSVAILIGDREDSNLLLITQEEDNLHLRVEVGTLENLIEEGDFNRFAMDVFTSSQLLLPYSVGMIAEEGQDTIVVLEDTVPLGDFSKDEMLNAINSSQRAVNNFQTLV